MVLLVLKKLVCVRDIKSGLLCQILFVLIIVWRSFLPNQFDCSIKSLVMAAWLLAFSGFLGVFFSFPFVVKLKKLPELKHQN